LQVNHDFALGGDDSGFLVVVEFAARDAVAAVALRSVKGDDDIMQGGAGAVFILHSACGVNGESGASFHRLRVGEPVGRARDLYTEFAGQVGDDAVRLITGVAVEARQRGHQQQGQDDDPEAQAGDGYAHGRRPLVSQIALGIISWSRPLGL
jgi:hypothetical protein